MKRIALATLLAVGAFAALPAQAVTCSFGGGSEADAHRADPVNDYDGAVFGNGSATVPYGDVYREGTDLTNVWVDAPSGTPGTASYKAKVHIRVANLLGAESNANYYFLFDYIDDPNTAADDTRIDRFVSARLTERGALIAEYGYTAPDPQTGITLITPTGTITDATFTTGVNGGFTIPAPLRSMGNLQPGTELTGITGEARVLLGARGTGLLGIADDTTNAEGCESLTV